jgi:hypothetical protein
MCTIDSRNLYERLTIEDIDMNKHDFGQLSSPNNNSSNLAGSHVDHVCSNLQTKLNLDAKHLKIALLASKVFLPSHPSILQQSDP